VVESRKEEEGGCNPRPVRRENNSTLLVRSADRLKEKVAHRSWKKECGVHRFLSLL